MEFPWRTLRVIITRVRFHSPAPLIIKDLRRSASKIGKPSAQLMLFSLSFLFALANRLRLADVRDRASDCERALLGRDSQAHEASRGVGNRRVIAHDKLRGRVGESNDLRRAG